MLEKPTLSATSDKSACPPALKRPLSPSGHSVSHAPSGAPQPLRGSPLSSPRQRATLAEAQRADTFERSDTCRGGSAADTPAAPAAGHTMRGKNLERAIRRLFESYASRGIHCQQNHPEQLHDGTLVRRHGFDFQILYQGTFYAFDAKECARRSFPMDKAKLHQLKAMLDVEKQGGTGFFLVYFTTSKQLVKFPVTLVRDALAAGCTSLAPEQGIKTSLNLLNIKD